MLIRIVVMFLVLAAGISFLLFAATCTGFFTEQRRKNITRYSFLAAFGSTIALLVIMGLYAFNV